MRRLALIAAFAACSRSSAPPPPPTPAAAPASAAAPVPDRQRRRPRLHRPRVHLLPRGPHGRGPLPVRRLRPPRHRRRHVPLHRSRPHPPVRGVGRPRAARPLRPAPRSHRLPSPLPGQRVPLRLPGPLRGVVRRLAVASPTPATTSASTTALHGDIATDLSGGRPYIPSTAHELAHVLMDADWDAPLWFRECVASLYESPVLAAGDRDPRHRRLALLPAARRAHSARSRRAHGLPLRHQRRRLPRQARHGRRRRHEGPCSTWPWRARRASGSTPRASSGRSTSGWRDSLATDRDGVATFTRVTGRAPTAPEADADWRAWVLRTR